MDTFEESNGTRSPFYENGVTKAKATAVGALDMCTATGQRTYRYAVAPVQQLGDVVFESASAVISAVDCMMARTWLAQRTRKHRVPLIEGGFHGERMNSSTLLNASEDQPCWACGQEITSPGRVFSCDAYARRAEQSGFTPATAPGAMALAAIMTGQLTQILHGNHELANTTLAADLRMGTMRLSLSQQTSGSIADLRLEQVGIGPRQLLDVNGRDRRQTFRVAGDCESLFFKVS